MSIAILKTQANPKDLSPNISLKENKIFFLFSQIENQRFSTSLNNNIMPNFKIALHNLEQLNQKSGATQ